MAKAPGIMAHIEQKVFDDLTAGKTVVTKELTQWAKDTYGVTVAEGTSDEAFRQGRVRAMEHMEQYVLHPVPQLKYQSRVSTDPREILFSEAWNLKNIVTRLGNQLKDQRYVLPNLSGTKTKGARRFKVMQTGMDMAYSALTAHMSNMIELADHNGVEVKYTEPVSGASL